MFKEGLRADIEDSRDSVVQIIDEKEGRGVRENFSDEGESAENIKLLSLFGHLNSRNLSHYKPSLVSSLSFSGCLGDLAQESSSSLSLQITMFYDNIEILMKMPIFIEQKIYQVSNLRRRLWILFAGN